jgi:hypothetical protein
MMQPNEAQGGILGPYFERLAQEPQPEPEKMEAEKPAPRLVWINPNPIAENTNDVG